MRKMKTGVTSAITSVFVAKSIRQGQLPVQLGASACKCQVTLGYLGLLTFGDAKATSDFSASSFAAADSFFC